MFGLLRLVVMMAVVLSVVYVCLLFWSRAGEKARLRKVWDEDQPPMPEDAYVREGLRQYEGSLRRKLLLGVYILPISAVVTLIYVTNFL